MSGPSRPPAARPGARRRPRPPYRPARTYRRGGHRTRRPVDWRLFAFFAFLLCLAVYAYGQFRVGQDVAVGFVLVPILLALCLPLFARLGRQEATFDLTNLLLTALALHFASAYFRLVSGADSRVYYEVGRELAGEFRSFNFAPDVGREFLGTGFLRYLSGLVQVVTFENRFATFLAFTLFAFFGLVLIYRAFLIAFPEGDRYRYAKLVFLWPSLVFWPSSLGKEAWMMLALGVTALGAARLFTRQPRGVLYLTLGLGGCLLCRPHVAALLVAAIFVAFVLRGAGGDPLRTAGKIVGVLGLFVATGFVASQNTEYFELENLGSDSIDQVAQGTIEQTQTGGSMYTPAKVDTPLDYPWAAVTVLVRPFPFEVNADESLINAAEGLFLVALVLTSLGRYRQLPGLIRRNPYLLFAATYLLTFVWAFSAISNFGILARQRTQVLPFLFIFLALPAVERLKGRRRRAIDAAESAESTGSADTVDPAAP
jgi:hypothetical protein